MTADFEKILAKSAYGLRRAKNRPSDPFGIKLHQRPVALLHFDYAVLY